MSRKLRLVLLCNFQKVGAGTIVDHINGIVQESRHTIDVVNFLGDIPRGFDLDRYDGLIIHYSLIACSNTYIHPSLRRRISDFRGLKVAFVQDDYRFIDDTVDALAMMGIHILFGLAAPQIIDRVYNPEKLPGTRRETVLTGYVPKHLLGRTLPAYEDRPLDVGYRARKTPAWLGELSWEKWLIAERFLRDVPAYGLRCDISCREEDRIYGENWTTFLTQCKAVLGTESGSSVCDFSGAIQREAEAHEAREPDIAPEALRDLYFKDADGDIMMNVISPRCFEAAALKTLMILYEGDYSGRLIAGRHYVPLKRDHSNMADVVRILRDPEAVRRIVDAAYDEVANNPVNWFSAMVQQVDRAIDETFRPEMAARRSYYSAFHLRWVLSREGLAGRGLSLGTNAAIAVLKVLTAVFPVKRRKALRRSILRVYWWLSMYRATRMVPGSRYILPGVVQSFLLKVAALDSEVVTEYLSLIALRRPWAADCQPAMSIVFERGEADKTSVRMMEGLSYEEICDELRQADGMTVIVPYLAGQSTEYRYPRLIGIGRNDPSCMASFLIWLSGNR